MKLIVFILLTNSWYSLSEKASIKSAGDSIDVLVMAAAVPKLPDGSYQMVPEQAEKIVPAYLIGLISHAFSANFTSSFRLYSVLMTLLTLGGLYFTLRKIGVGNKGCFLALLFWMTSPYNVRYYYSFPGMVSDPMFVTGLAVLLYGMVRVNIKSVFIACCIMVAAGQLALITLPAIFVWLLLDRAWFQHSLAKRLVVFGGVVALQFSLLYLLRTLTAPFTHSEVPLNVETWVLAQGFTWEFTLFLLKGFFTLSTPLTIFITALVFYGGTVNGRVIGMVFLAFSLVMLPYLTGPDGSQEGVSHLNAIAYGPILILAFSLLPQRSLDKLPGWMVWLFIALAMIASLHPLMSVLGTWSDTKYFSVGGIVFINLLILSTGFIYKVKFGHKRILKYAIGSFKSSGKAIKAR